MPDTKESSLGNDNDKLITIFKEHKINAHEGEYETKFALEKIFNK